MNTPSSSAPLRPLEAWAATVLGVDDAQDADWYDGRVDSIELTRDLADAAQIALASLEPYGLAAFGLDDEPRPLDVGSLDAESRGAAAGTYLAVRHAGHGHVVWLEQGPHGVRIWVVGDDRDARNELVSRIRERSVRP